MVPMVVSTVLALASAAVVLAVASAAGGRRDDRPAGAGAYLADVRAGLRTWRSERRDGARPGLGPEPVDMTIDDFLDSAAVPDPAYLGVEDLTQTLARARERAVRGVSVPRPSLGRRPRVETSGGSAAPGRG